MTTKTHTYLELGRKGDNGTSFSSDGRKSSWTPTYNLDDVYNHISELRQHIHDGKKPFKNTQFVIRTITTVTTEIEATK